MKINADPSLVALAHFASSAWVASPDPGVERVLLERDGDEVARATSIVRYAPGSRFARHVHDLGEEFFVLDGVFSDERGAYAASTYVRNPPGSAHAPFSAEGCVILVKLRHMRRSESRRVVVQEGDWRWTPLPESGCAEMTLFDDGSVRVALVKLDARARLADRLAPAGEELFVLRGAVTLAGAQELARWSWYRTPGPIAPGLAAQDPALLLRTTGDLPPAA